MVNAFHERTASNFWWSSSPICWIHSIQPSSNIFISAFSLCKMCFSSIEPKSYNNEDEVNDNSHFHSLIISFQNNQTIKFLQHPKNSCHNLSWRSFWLHLFFRWTTTEIALVLIQAHGSRFKFHKSVLFSSRKWKWCREICCRVSVCRFEMSKVSEISSLVKLGSSLTTTCPTISGVLQFLVILYVVHLLRLYENVYTPKPINLQLEIKKQILLTRSSFLLNCCCR